MKHKFVENQPVMNSATAVIHEFKTTDNNQQEILNLSDDATRKTLFLTHPIVTKGYVMPTPPLKRVFDIVARLILQRCSGCAFAAHPRFGKTSAIKYLASTLPESFPGVPIYSIIARKSRNNNPNTFHRAVFEDCGGICERKTDANAALKLLVRKWQVAAASADVRQIVLLVDEAQRYTLDELTYLADATNRFAADAFFATVVCFGSTELSSIRDVAMLASRGDLLGRFLTRFYAFDVIASVHELQDVLKAYDDPDIAAYPPSNDWSFSRFFFPRAYRAGWRLAGEAGELWSAFDRIARERLGMKAHIPLNVGMEWVASTIEDALVDNSECDPVNQPIRREDWERAVRGSGFVESLGITYVPGQVPVAAPHNPTKKVQAT